MTRKIFFSGIINGITFLISIITLALFKFEIEIYVYGLIGFNIGILTSVLVNSFFVIHYFGKKEAKNAFVILLMTVLVVIISLVVIGHVPALMV